MEQPWRHVLPTERERLALGAGERAIELVRRGADHGLLVLGSAAPRATADPAAAWRSVEPAFLPGLVTGGLHEVRGAVDATLAMFDRLRDGQRFLDELEERLWDDEDFVYAGSTIDAVDRREIEKVFVDAPAGPGRYHARDLSAKLSWIADDQRDLSMRVRFSFGHEATGDWLTPGPRALWSDRFAERVFPECAVVTECTPLREILDAALDASWRLSERIVYGNAPGGGAVFHHDADPGQRGVVFAQLAGETVWLAAPRRELEELLDRPLGDEPDRDTWEALNTDPALTARLATRGRLFVLGPGDALLLPSSDSEQCVWHSVFGVGDAPSLAHSYAVFDAVA